MAENWTPTDFLNKWSAEVIALQASGFKHAEIEMCIGKQTFEKFCSEPCIITTLGLIRLEKRANEGEYMPTAYWGGMALAHVDAPRALYARPKIAALQSRRSKAK